MFLFRPGALQTQEQVDCVLQFSDFMIPLRCVFAIKLEFGFCPSLIIFSPLRNFCSSLPQRWHHFQPQRMPSSTIVSASRLRRPPIEKSPEGARSFLLLPSFQLSFSCLNSSSPAPAGLRLYGTSARHCTAAHWVRFSHAAQHHDYSGLGNTAPLHPSRRPFGVRWRQLHKRPRFPVAGRRWQLRPTNGIPNAANWCQGVASVHERQRVSAAQCRWDRINSALKVSLQAACRFVAIFMLLFWDHSNMRE